MTTPDHTIIQLTDTHLSTPGDLVHGVMDTTRNLRDVLAHLDASDQNVDAIVLSGDLADAGKPAAYECLRSMVEPTAARLGASVVYAVGNHDDRASFRTGLGLRDVGPHELGTPYDVVHMVGDLRIIVLDSTSPGRHDGSLEVEQLDWLADQLRHRTPRGTILVLHHPPIHSPVSTVDFLRLNDPDSLESVLAGSDVRMILCGHAHHTGASAIAGIPVWIGPPISYRTDPMPPAGRHRAGVGFGFSRIDVFGRSAVATAVDVVGAREVYSEPRSVAMERLWALTPLAR
ncbi:metallophosphoesterase [Williamsia phyllosphaerae]|uniref:3',5'-cyclic adenosine monophosphate phosphodiesterase CpdA n=1 Tax=Williamsia phyllosphaerae TaxID=885042 RepID=A0ABQ1V160_9NOCA|nr:metallophosphoesterase [Williamsia phyllosphaerae]GGF33914.1 3',5'-cyclic adenosine monophosphate phosphodiesterase CpdA [Williamsia phyllosphaerae]